MHVPPVQSANGAKFTVSELLHLNGSSTFSDYATAVMVDKVVTLDVYGRPVLQEGALPKTKVTYNKTVTMKGAYLIFHSSYIHMCIGWKAQANDDRPEQIPGVQRNAIPDLDAFESQRS